MTRGAFIVLEGLDRCGKTTQVELLVQRLEREGKRARLQKFPGKSLDSRMTGPKLTRRSLHWHWEDDKRIPAIKGGDG